MPPLMSRRQTTVAPNPVRQLDGGGVFAAAPTNEIPKQAQDTFLVTFSEGFQRQPINNELVGRSIIFDLSGWSEWCVVMQCSLHCRGEREVEGESYFSGPNRMHAFRLCDILYAF